MWRRAGDTLFSGDTEKPGYSCNEKDEVMQNTGHGHAASDSGQRSREADRILASQLTPECAARR